MLDVIFFIDATFAAMTSFLTADFRSIHAFAYSALCKRPLSVASASLCQDYCSEKFQIGCRDHVKFLCQSTAQSFDMIYSQEINSSVHIVGLRNKCTEWILILI